MPRLSEAKSSGGKALTLPFKPNLLFTESARKFKKQHEALKRTLSPRDYIEELYVAEMAENIWETQRLSWCKAVLINSHWCSAIEALLDHMDLDYEAKRNLAFDYFGDESAKAKVCDHLAYSGSMNPPLRPKPSNRLGRILNQLTAG